MCGEGNKTTLSFSGEKQHIMQNQHSMEGREGLQVIFPLLAHTVS
jgi:hypothetical protein